MTDRPAPFPTGLRAGAPLLGLAVTAFLICLQSAALALSGPVWANVLLAVLTLAVIVAWAVRAAVRWRAVRATRPWSLELWETAQQIPVGHGQLFVGTAAEHAEDWRCERIGRRLASFSRVQDREEDGRTETVFVRYVLSGPDHFVRGAHLPIADGEPLGPGLRRGPARAEEIRPVAQEIAAAREKQAYLLDEDETPMPQQQR